MRPASLFTGLLLTLATFLVAANAAGLERLLAADQAPDGVVIEIVEGETAALEWALPRVREIATRLRARFPGLPIVVVSHGQEQFGLLKSEREPLAPIHAQAKSLIDDDIGLHVCGAHAGWYGHTEADFADFVDVSPSGPAQINDYVALGYTRIRL
ncbi:MAG: DsrE family protein [Gammaproteobacteria bacterium]|nr:DsrE family protein [Gammaproteobacteria bacterium]